MKNVCIVNVVDGSPVFHKSRQSPYIYHLSQRVLGYVQHVKYTTSKKNLITVMNILININSLIIHA